MPLSQSRGGAPPPLSLTIATALPTSHVCLKQHGTNPLESRPKPVVIVDLSRQEARMPLFFGENPWISEVCS